MKITLRKKIKLNKKCTQFLEMTLDSRLNGEEHVDRVRAKTKRALNTKVVAGINWGTLKILYSAVCRSKMDYGCQQYSAASPWKLKKSIVYRFSELYAVHYTIKKITQY